MAYLSSLGPILDLFQTIKDGMNHFVEKSQSNQAGAGGGGGGEGGKWAGGDFDP